MSPYRSLKAEKANNAAELDVTVEKIAERSKKVRAASRELAASVSVPTKIPWAVTQDPTLQAKVSELWAALIKVKEESPYFDGIFSSLDNKLRGLLVVLQSEPRKSMEEILELGIKILELEIKQCELRNKELDGWRDVIEAQEAFRLTLNMVTGGATAGGEKEKLC